MINNILDIQVKKQSEKIAIYQQNKTVTYKQLAADVSKLAFFLDSLGFKKEDIVFHYFKDEYLLILAMLSSAKMGTILVSLPMEINSLKLKDLKEQTQASFLLSDISMGFDEIVESFVLKYEDFITLEKYEKNYEVNPELPWQIVIGSGTTNKEKLFEVSHNLEIERIKISQNSINMKEDDIVLSLIKLNFNSTKIRFLATLYTGASYFIFDNQTSNLIEICMKYKISVLYASVFHVEHILNNLDSNEKNALFFLRVLSIGGSVISEDLKERVKKYLTSNLYISYGTNDIGGITSTNINSVFKVEQTVGLVLKNIKVEIVDKNNNKLPVDEIGYIRVQSLGMIKEYLRDEKNTKRYLKNNWFYPGDLGKFNKNKELIYCGRSDYMMIVNGINVYPSLIESRLLEHKDVKFAVCIPFKDAISQDIPICAVVLKENSDICEAELLNFCFIKLGFTSAKQIVFLKDIPINSLGKIQRSKLQENMYIKLLKYKRKFSIKLSKSDILDTSFLDKWLEEVFDIKTYTSTNPSIYSVCQKTILLIKRLLQISQIPSFYDGSICAIQEDESNFFIEIELEYINQIPLKFYIDILNNAFIYIFKMINYEPNSENKIFIINNIISEILNPILQNMPKGSYRVDFLSEVFRNNIPYIHIGNGIYQLGWGSKSKKIDRSSTVYDSAMGLTLSGNKIISSNLLRLANLPTAQHGYTNDKREAIEIAKQLAYPVVVKPIDLERGEGVSVNIHNESELLEAFDKAYELSVSKNVIVEKQVSGVCHRIFIADGKLLYAVKRLPIGVYADGISTISQLIDRKNIIEENKFFWEKKYTYFKDNTTMRILAKNGFLFDSIPKEGTFIALRDIETTQLGGTDEDVSKKIHKSNIDIAIRASKLFELGIAGVDIITSDIAKPWYETKAIINEINYAPALGAGEISKTKLKEFINNYIEDDGRIPVEIFIGDKNKSLEKALFQQQKYIEKGMKAYFLDSNKTYDQNNEEVFFVDNHINQRCQALLLNTQVDALVIVDEDNIFCKEYCVFDKVSKVVFSNPY